MFNGLWLPALPLALMPIVCPLKFAALLVEFLMPNPGMIAMNAAALLPTWTKLSSCFTFRVVDLSPESTVVSISSVSDTITVVGGAAQLQGDVDVAPLAAAQGDAGLPCMSRSPCAITANSYVPTGTEDERIVPLAVGGGLAHGAGPLVTQPHGRLGDQGLRRVGHDSG